MKNRKLISENRDLLKKICKDIKEFNPYLDEVKSQYELLELGKFNNDVFNEIKKGPQSIIQIFKNKINREIKQTGITTSMIIKNMKSSSEERVNEFYEAVEALLQFQPDRSFNADHPRLNISNISFKNEKFMILREDQESILEEHCRIYLETEEEFNLYNKLENFLSSYSDLQKELDEAGFKYNTGIVGVHGIHYYFLEYETGQPRIKPEMIRTALTQKKKIDRFHNQRNQSIQKRQNAQSMDSIITGTIKDAPISGKTS